MTWEELGRRFGAGRRYALPDGSQFLCLSVDYANHVVRLMWTEGRRGHEDVDMLRLVDARCHG